MVTNTIFYTGCIKYRQASVLMWRVQVAVLVVSVVVLVAALLTVQETLTALVMVQLRVTATVKAALLEAVLGRGQSKEEMLSE